MNFGLFGPNLLLLLSTLNTVLFCSALFLWPGLLRPRRLGVLFGSGLGISLAVQLIFNNLYAGQKLPLFMWMSLPLTCSAALLAVGLWGMVTAKPVQSKKKRQEAAKPRRLLAIVPIGLAAGALVTGTLFAGALVNSYFHYYPTLYSVFSSSKGVRLAALDPATIIKYQPSSHISFDNNSLEKTLVNTPSEITKGSIYNVNIPGTASKFKARDSWLYVPPVAFNPEKINLPVIVLLGGIPGKTNDWLDHTDIETVMNQFAARHSGITPLVVMTDNSGNGVTDTECINSPRGNVETYLTQDVPNFIKAHFDVSPDQAHWALGGFSDGGMCSIMLTLRHQDTYRYFLDFGGEIGPEIGTKAKTVHDLFGNSNADWLSHQPEHLLQSRSFKGSGGFFAAGKADSYSVTSAEKQLYQDAQAANMDAVYESIDGEHTFTVWQQAYKDALPWLSNRIGATVCAVNCY